MFRRRLLRPLALAALVFASATARAQDPSEESRAIAEDVRRLRNNPSAVLADDADRVRRIVLGLLERRSEAADAALRELLRDVRTHTNVVEQILRLTIYLAPHRLLDDAVERLRVEAGSALERRMEPVLLHADAEVVRRLGEIALDGARPVATRAQAARLLGRTGDDAALEPLVALWGGPEREIRDAARDAFDAILPGAAAAPDEARAVLERLRRDDVPLSEALRRLLRERAASPPPAAEGSVAKEYTELALAMLPKASLDELLRLYVIASPVPAVREAAVHRLAAYPYDDAAEPDARLRTARALFTALRREDTGDVEGALLSTLAALAPAVRGSVSPDEMDALLARVRPGATVARSTRLLAVRLAGELRDERGVAALEDAYRALGDGEPEARLAMLAALQEIPVDRTAWLVERAASERRPEILRKLMVLIGRSRDPAAVGAFARILADAGTDAELRRDAAKALATQWAARSDTAARDALVRTGLADPDAGVRATAAGALGVSGPGREATFASLIRASSDVDPDVRRAAARSAILLDEAAAAAALTSRFAEDAAVFEVYRDHLVETVRRDQSPDRALAATDALVAAGLRRFAVAVLESAVAAAPDAQRGRARLVERLTRTYLDEGRPGDAEPLARGLLAAEGRDDTARAQSELLLARVLTASRSAERLAEAERRLGALGGRLTGADGLDVAATLADCRLARGDAIGALDALPAEAAVAEVRALPDALRRRIDLLREDVARGIGAERRRVLDLVDRLHGDGEADARRALRSPEFGRIAAWHLSREIAATRDFAAVRRLLAGVAAVTGGEPLRLADDATEAQIATVVTSAREALAKVGPPTRSAH